MAAFWPANALLLGLLVRYPRLAASGTWAAAAIGYGAANLVAGTSLLGTVWLAAANLCGVAAGWWLFGQVPVATRFLKRQMSVVLMFGIGVASSAVAALVGSGTGPLLFNTPWLTALGLWFSTELINSVLILPVMLSLPTPQEARRVLKKRRSARRRRKYLAPVLALVASGLAITRRTVRLAWRSTSSTQSVRKGSAVATTTSADVTCTGSTLWRSA